jgi:PEP-CTERM motif
VSRGPIATESVPMRLLGSRQTDAHTVLTALALGLTLALLAPIRKVRADLIYNVTAQGSNDFIPFENDGTPNRPFGSELGNEITFGGTARYLDHVQVVFGSIGPKEFDTYTLDLYKNNGPNDRNSGLPEPGTLVAQLTTEAWNIPLSGNGTYGVDWYFNPILVPDTLTGVVSSTYSTTTPGQYMGPFAAVFPPLTGSALNTVWYGDGTPGNWTANNTWAINDGGITNYFDMRFDALQSVPEPSSLHLMVLGLGGCFFLARWRRHNKKSGNSCFGSETRSIA